MSSIRKTDSGIWYFHRYYTDPETGERERVHRSLRTRDEQEAKKKQEALDEKFDRLERGEEPLTVKEATDTYLTHRERRVKMEDLSPATLRMDRYGIEQLLNWLGEEGREEELLVNIDREDVEDLMDWRMEQVSRSSVGANLQHLKRFFSFSVEREWIDRHPMKGLKIPDTGKKPDLKVPYEREEWKDIERAAEELVFEKEAPKPLYIAFYLIVKTGMRLGEVLDLKWEAGPQDHGTDHSRSYAYIKGEGRNATAIIYHKRTQREIPIGLLWDAIAKLERDSKWLFPSDRKEGERVQTHGYSRQISRLLDKLGYENYSAHSLRHGYITHRLREDVSVKKLSDMVGHRTSTLIERYSHLLPRDLEGLIQPRNQTEAGVE